MRSKRYPAALALAILTFIYLLSGVYTLESGQHTVVLRFGRPVKVIKSPGIHYHLPFPIESIRRAHVAAVQTVAINADNLGRQECFTGDENLVTVEAMISFDIKNLTGYLFGSNDVERLIRTIGQKVLSLELAKITVDDAMTSAKSVLRLTIRDKMQTFLDDLDLGIRIISVELTDISPPFKVNSAFKAVSNARVKKQEIIRDAEGYANATIPRSRGTAARITQEANAYADELINQTNAQTAAFESLMIEYEQNPQVFKQQRFIETLAVVSTKSKISINSNAAGTTFYLSNEKEAVQPILKSGTPSIEESDIEVIEID